MTSGIFHPIPIDSISVERAGRQRSELDDIDELADSMRRLGQIHPIIVTRDHALVAGERRLTAARQLGWTHITAQYQDELDESTLFAIELEENIKRKDISWQDRTAAIARYHQLRAAEEPEWSQERTAAAIGITQPNVARHLAVAKEITRNPKVAEAPKFSVAVGLVQRAEERRRQDDLLHTHAPRMDTHVLNADFLEWAPTYAGPKFNLIHCDFPYGINAHQHAGQNSTLDVNYVDTADTYWRLFGALAAELDNFCAESAHIIFWFSPNIYCRTWEMLKLLNGFRFDEHPLIWQRGENEGIAPDPARRPRRVYEMAFFGWRGDRKILRTRANSIVAPTERERHPHEKSETALRHFFGMLVDERTRLFDPTCGSGSALRAAHALGAADYLGLELNPEYADIAQRSLLVVDREP